MHRTYSRERWTETRRRRAAIAASVGALIAVQWVLAMLVLSTDGLETSIVATLRAYPGLLYAVGVGSSVLACSGLLYGIVGNTRAQLQEIRDVVPTVLGAYAFLRLLVAMPRLGHPIGTWVLGTAALAVLLAVCFRLLLTWVLRAADVPPAS